MSALNQCIIVSSDQYRKSLVWVYHCTVRHLPFKHFEICSVDSLIECFFHFRIYATNCQCGKFFDEVHAHVEELCTVIENPGQSQE
jgi:hypothetical protein